MYVIGNDDSCIGRRTHGMQPHGTTASNVENLYTDDILIAPERVSAHDTTGTVGE